MLFTLSVCENYAICNGNIVTAAPSNHIAVVYPFIIVEQFLWYETKLLPPPLSTIRTRGMSNDVVKFQPGWVPNTYTVETFAICMRVRVERDNNNYLLLLFCLHYYYYYFYYGHRVCVCLSSQQIKIE